LSTRDAEYALKLFLSTLNIFEERERVLRIEAAEKLDSRNACQFGEPSCAIPRIVTSKFKPSRKSPSGQT